ncbi:MULTISPECIES: FAD-dependent oxidoreductase [Enterococcus]|uniref:CoA disulfide reductase n=1 Tax=Enterococcus sulfureus ATCC 49903 TaxID=1140003 RepID=S0P096_9ENTE|nr:FAD-dependent oxidoreductase [Enterococcus sulfureus]EOT49375.1 CoA disulfide reductase [Enterococcus sulfureus ATCC 49903]EOT87242.1 CoA disulfide reductase [Enterococcus sulfureus ATCC 49903]
MKVIIVGGVAGGMSAATRLRRLNEQAEIIVFEKGPYVSFANCGLPYYVSGEIDSRDKLLVQTPKNLKSRFDLDVRPEHEVLKIDPIEHTVLVRHGEETFTERYDKLILSPGAKPFIPPIEGITTAEHVYSLRNVPDLDQLMSGITDETKEAVVIGAGFIGLEMAENLHKRGIKVTLVEQAPHVLPPLDEEMAAYIKKELEKQGVTVLTSDSAVAFLEKGRLIELASGKQLNTDLTLLSVGVVPASDLAKDVGVQLGMRGGILVDEDYQTSQADIYAVGDAIIVKNQITGADALISLASPANRQGRQVADVLSGLQRKNQGSIGTAIVRVFDQTAASTGLSERQAKLAGFATKVVHVTGKDHAGYFPGATDITLKLIFDAETGVIYGAQGIGQKGVDKRIDSLATAIKGKLTVFDLPELEFTYAPPFGSAKDPINMLGYVAMNQLEGISESIQWYELASEVKNGAVLLDVRNPSEFANGRFPHALEIPLDELREKIETLDKTKDYIVSCHSGLRSYIAERMLKQARLHVKNLDGAFALYQTVKPEEIDYV